MTASLLQPLRIACAEVTVSLFSACLGDEHMVQNSPNHLKCQLFLQVTMLIFTRLEKLEENNSHV